MTNRPVPPRGAPCWVDLWTSDIEGSRQFYAELFGWQAGEPSPDHGGYFMFTRAGVPVAGAMGDMGERRANDTWKPFFATEDIERTLELAAAHGATARLPAMAIDDLGSQAVIADPAGAVTGIWQPGSFPGFTVIHEHGTPSFIAIDVHDYHSRSRLLSPSVRLGSTRGGGRRSSLRRLHGPGQQPTDRRYRRRGGIAGVRRIAVTGRCSGKATMLTPRSRKSARWAARCSPRLPTTASGGSPEWRTPPARAFGSSGRRVRAWRQARRAKPTTRCAGTRSPNPQSSAGPRGPSIDRANRTRGQNIALSKQRTHAYRRLLARRR